jgi:hypothetical protein
MRADNSHHIVTATRHRAIAALRRMDNAGQLISFDAVAREGHVSRSWLYTIPVLWLVRATARRAAFDPRRSPRIRVLLTSSVLPAEHTHGV